MTSAAFRDSMQSLGWSRRDPDLPVNTSGLRSSSTPLLSRIQSWNPFGDQGYVRLPTTENPGAALPAPTRREEEEGWFALSRWDRLLVFGACNLAALACFVICFAFWPLVIVPPRKFAILWSFGSVFFLASWAVLMGPWVYLTHLTSGARLPFTAAYFGSIGLTIYFSVGMAALIWYLVSYFPMGTTGLRFATSFGARRAAAWMTG